MSKKSQMAKMLKVVQHELVGMGPSKDAQKSKATDSPIFPNVSTIEKASFLDECDTYGNPLHSTALEDDFSPNLAQNKEEAAKEGAAKGRWGPSKKVNSATPKRPTPAGRGQTKRRASKVVQPKGSPQQKKVKPKARPQKEIAEGIGEEDLTEAQRGSSAPQKKAPAPQKKALVRKEQDTEADDSRSSGEEEEEIEVSAPGSSPRPVHRKRRTSLSSEDLTNEDISWNPSQKKARLDDVGKQRKSSVERRSLQGSRSSQGPRRSLQGSWRKSSSGSASPSKRDEQRRRNVKNPTDLDVVLDSFLEFVSEYMDAVDSNAVLLAIDALSSSFEDQLTEKITASKELKFLKRENAKMNAAINRKRARLLEAKNELIRSEAQLRALQKDQARLEQRLTDIRKGTTFLKDLGHLHKSYLDHRKAHPNQAEEYGPSSLPALLLEARDVLGTEDQLKTVNERLQQALDRVAHNK
ncbi:centromere protein U isoform X1 [Coregonus clupeaformis]|uniref:centromere protein U isoform X1 n=2 Tax=Coregonus clupeaformis TaxID=59861 RepID=UPI001E1C8251|nr:centromere protein U isoform X1 [Coregonus clupeaformis]